jgi:hypothetical protein
MRVRTKIRPAMAGRYINQAQFIAPLHFIFSCRGLIHHARGFQDRLSCYLAVPDEDENTYLNPSLRGGQPFFGWTTWQSHS